MTLLILGIFLWTLVHLFKRLAPGMRDGMIEKLGAGPVKGLVALLALASLGLIAAGFKAAPFVAVYQPPGWGTFVNNPLMLCAVILFGMGASRGRLRPLLRHPMLTGVIVWSVAHLLVNGDSASLVLFVSMLVWAVSEMLVINATSDKWVRPPAGPAIHDLRLIFLSVVVFAAVSLIHGWIGPSPFPG